jgi:glycosyltransferase involved in cell wall biosynthesis
MKTESDSCISVVVPVYNEGGNIQPCLRGLWGVLQKHAHEILICYDYDADPTLPAIEAMADRPPTVRLVKNDLGKGVACALRAGFRAARGDVVVSFMCDLSDPPEGILAMAEKIRWEGAQVVSGSRYMKGGKQVGGPWLKGFLSRAVGWSLYWLAGLGTRDATTNFRAYSGEFLRKINLESRHGFEVGLELTVKAHRMGLKVMEVPSIWRDRTRGQSRFRLFSWLPHYLRWYLKGMTPSLGRGLVLFGGLIYLLLTQVSWRPALPLVSLDFCWNLVLHQSFEVGRKFGEEIIFTYGPYGFVSGPLLYSVPSLYYPATFPWVLGIQSFFCGALILGWRRFTGLYVPRAWQAAAVLIAVLFCLVEIPLVLGLLLFLFHGEERENFPSWVLVLLAVALALASLIKFTYFLLSVWIFALITLEEIFRRRRIPRLPLLFLLSLLGFWVTAGQEVGGLIPYIWNSLRISAGYTEGMVLSWEAGHPLPLPFLITAGTLITALAVTGWRRDRFWGLMPAVFLSGVNFLIFKAAYVRHDWLHEMITWLAAPALALLYSPVLWVRLREKKLKALLLGILLLACTGPGQWNYFYQKLQTLPSQASAARSALSGRSNLPAVYARRQRQIAASFPFPRAEGTVDLYPYEQGFVIAQPWKYSPRPVIQSYSAYTPALAEINARHLQSPKAPQTIFFRVHPLDNRYPSLDDGLSWPELLVRYDLCETLGPYIRLQRAIPPRSWQLVSLAEITGRLGQEIEIPEIGGGAIWAEVDIQPTLRQRVVSFFYKAPLPGITVNGKFPFRLLPSLARSGFLLSPLVWQTLAFETLAVDPSRGMPVKSIRIEAGQGGYYRPEVRIRLFRLIYPLQRAFAPRLFERSSEVRWRLGNPRPAEKELVPVEKVVLQRQKEGVLLRCSEPRASVRLPSFPLTGASHLALKVDVTSPAQSLMTIAYATEDHPEYTLLHTANHYLEPGRNTVFMAIPAEKLKGSLLLQLEYGPGEYVLHGLEVRAAP